MDEKKEWRGKAAYMLIRGCIDSPKKVKVAKRKGLNGEYFEGMKYDLVHMLDRIESNDEFMLYTTVENMRNMKCANVIQEIKKFAKFGKENECRAIFIYYTGHTEELTGNWTFSDGVVRLDHVIKAIKVFREQVFMELDCCYAHIWTSKLYRYKNEKICKLMMIKAASCPGKVAYDTAKGGLFTLFLCEQSLKCDSCGKFNDIHWSRSHISNGNYNVSYLKAAKILIKEDKILIKEDNDCDDDV